MLFKKQTSTQIIYKLSGKIKPSQSYSMLCYCKNNYSAHLVDVLPTCSIVMLVRKQREVFGAYLSTDSSVESLRRGQFQLYVKIRRGFKNSGENCTEILKTAVKNRE